MKNFLVTVIFVLFMIACEKQEIGLRTDVDIETIKGNWMDIGQISPLGQVNSSTKGALISLMQDGTFTSHNENLTLGIGSSGKWTYDSETKKIILVLKMKLSLEWRIIKSKNSGSLIVLKTMYLMSHSAFIENNQQLSIH